MPDPLTINYGPWSPDLQNVATEVIPQPGPLTVPCADVLNVYYQDGAYRSLPSPAPFGSALPSQCLNAYTWYDNVEGQELIFEGVPAGIYALIDGLQTPIPIENALSVFATPVQLRIALTGTQGVPGNGITMSLGFSGGVRGAGIYNGTMVAGYSYLGAGARANVGYQQASFGSLSPTVDYNNDTILQIYLNSNLNLQTGVTTYRFNVQYLGYLPQNHFTAFKIVSLGVNLQTSAASFQQISNTTTWTWPVNVGLVQGRSYLINLAS